MRHLLATATVVALLVSSGSAVAAQEASPDPGASPTPEQLAAAEERLATATCLGKPATIVAIAGFETLGTDGADVIVGTETDDVIDGAGGNDRICAGPGADTVDGGAGNDRIDGGLGDDTLDGGAGNDAITGGEGDDMVTGSAGKDRLKGAAGDDTLDGGKGKDTCVGGEGTDWLPGCNEKKRTRGTVVVSKNTKLKGPHKGRFIIGSNGVTLDCDGHTVAGAGRSVPITAVSVSGRKRVTVRNCDIRDFGGGIYLERSQRNTISDNRLVRVGNGMNLQQSDRNRIVRNSLDDVTEAGGTWGFGIYNGSDGNEVRDNTANDVNGFSYVVGGGTRITKDNDFTGNLATNGVAPAFIAIPGALRNEFSGNTAIDNQDWGFKDETDGFRGDAGTDNFYSDNTCSGVGQGGQSSPSTLCE